MPVALENSRAPGVTEGMIRHVRVWEPYQKTVSPSWIIFQLNRRLGTAFETPEDAER